MKRDIYADPLEVLGQSCYGCIYAQESVGQLVSCDGYRFVRRCDQYSGRRAMTKTDEDQIVALLRAWYRWQLGYSPNLGSGRASATCRDFKIPNSRFDDVLAESDQRRLDAEQREWAAQAQQVDACVDSLHWTLRASIQTEMANAEVKAEIWRNARITREQNEIYYREAKVKLMPMFVDRALMHSEEAIFEK